MNLWEALNAQPVAGSEQDMPTRWTRAFLNDEGRMTVYPISPRDGLTALQAACILATDGTWSRQFLTHKEYNDFFATLEKVQNAFNSKYREGRAIAAQTITDHVVGL